MNENLFPSPLSLLINSSNRIYIKKPKTQAIKWSAYLIPLEPWVWHMLAIMIVTSSLMIRMIEEVVQKENTPMKSIRYSTPIFEIFFDIIGAFSGQGRYNAMCPS